MHPHFSDNQEVDRRLKEKFEQWAKSVRRQTSGPQNILLAEDDPGFRKLLAKLLRDDGYNVFEAADGIQMIEKLKFSPEGEQFWDLVISDIRMPGATGLEVLADLHDTAWKVPVILMTAFGDSETHLQAQRLGARAAFDKPFDFAEFLVTVERVLTLET